MKWGRLLYRRGDYLGARGQFGIVAEKFPDSPLAEKAIFLTAQAMARSLDPSEMEEAIGIFEQVVKSGGSLSLRARLAQASLLNALKRPKEALGVLDRILESEVPIRTFAMRCLSKKATHYSPRALKSRITTNRPSRRGGKSRTIPMRQRYGATRP